MLICMGSGGVGKTTLTAALALSAARKGQKVLALTVDPSQRLVAQMGIDPSVAGVQKVDKETGSGSLYTCILNSKAVFDEFILRHSTDQQLAQRLMQNSLYQQLSSTLSGSQEFTSLELLYSEYYKGEWDLIVLDTPPTQHALDFLEAPKVLRALFDESVLKWFRSDRSFADERWYSKVFQFGTKKVLQALEILTGQSFIRSLIDFFQSVSGVQGAIVERGKMFDELLRAPSTGFIGITGFDRNQFGEMRELKGHLAQLGVSLSGAVVNRVFPFPKQDKEEPFQNERLRLELDKYRRLYAPTSERLEEFLASFKEPVLLLPRRLMHHQRLLDLQELKELDL